jgi:hypothetical protein
MTEEQPIVPPVPEIEPPRTTPRKPEPDARLRKVVLREIERIHNPNDRKEYYYLLDNLNGTELPPIRNDGRAAFPSRLAVLRSAVVHAIKLSRRDISAKTLEKYLQFVEWISEASLAQYRVSGDEANGYTVEKL